MKSFTVLPRLMVSFGLLVMFSIEGWGTNTYSKVERSFTTDHSSQKLATFNIRGDFNVTGASVQCAINNSNQCITNPANTFTNKTKHVKDDASLSNLNSASATLEIPSGATIKWAGLLWQGHIHGSKSDIGNPANANAIANAVKNDGIDYDIVKFKTPDGIEHTIDIDHNDTSVMNHFSLEDSDEYRFFYQGFKDVTDIVKNSYSSTAKTFTVGGIQSTDGDVRVMKDPIDNWNDEIWSIGNHGNWSLVVVFEEPNYTFQNVSVYDGFKIMKVITSGDFTTPISVPIHIDGFLTPSSGTVKSKLMFYAGGGNKSAARDSFEILNANTGVMDKLSNAVNPSENVFNDTFSYFGTNVNSVYHHLMDIDTFDISSKMGNSQSQTDLNLYVKYNNGADIAFVGLVAFSTQLYHPDVCYVENIFKGTTNISGIGAQVNEDDNLTVRVYIKNKGNEIASKVQVQHQFDSLFPYAGNSANYNNSNPPYETVMPPSYTRTSATDSSGNDLYEYNTTSLLAKINLGVGANNSQGGDFNSAASATPTYAVFEYNATVKALDNNYSNVYKASYVNTALGIDYSNNPITLSSCDGAVNSFYGYSAPVVSVTGDYNVVYASHANGALSSGYNYNLPTAIASRADNYKVIALNTGTDILKDMNTTVAVELVDASSGTCSTHTPISNVKTWIPFKNVSTANFSAADIINGVILADSQAAEKFYQKAGKNVKFRVSYPNDGSGGAVIMSETVPGKFHLLNFPSYAGDSCYAEFNATTYNPANGNIQGQHTYSQVPEACGNAGQSGASALTQHEVNVCLECIYGTSVNYVCSKDNFAIRPEAFHVTLSDQNQTNFITKQVMSNNISGAVSLNLASGYKYFAEVNATNHVDNNATSGYTTTEGLDSIWTPGTTVVTGCNDDTNKSSILNFSNGLVEANLSVDQVGKYNLNITDDTWANVDSNVSVMTHHTSPFFLSGTDCTLNSAVTSTLGTYSGCNISSNHVNSDAGITYVDTGVEYRPYDFNLTSIQMSRGQNFTGTIMGQNTWTYMNSVNVDENMSVRYFGPIKAEGKNGTLMSNYVNNCYAQPVNMDLNLTFPVTAGLPNWRYRLQEVNATTVWRDTNAMIAAPATNVSFPLVTIPQTSFLKNQNGLADMNLSLNFDRNQTLTVNPITVGLKNFQVKCQVAGNCSMRADFSTAHLPDTNVTTDNNTTFVYGRIIPRDVRTFGSGVFSANGWYEVFGTTAIVATALPISKNDPVWSTNTLHSDTNDGDANVTVVITGNNPANAAAVNGMETYTFGAGYALGGYKAHILTKPWLWYGTTALPYLDPNGPAQAGADNLDCLTHPCFNINVAPDVGATGSAKSTNTATKASKRSTEGGGAWKSTKDYAPAIR